MTVPAVTPSDWRTVIHPEPPVRTDRLDGPVDGCRHCGIAEKDHPAEVYGLGHFNTTQDVPKHYVAPPPELVAARLAARQANGLPIAAVDEETGRALTHLVQATCRCGAVAVCTPEQADGARCGPCVLEDARALTAKEP